MVLSRAAAANKAARAVIGGNDWTSKWKLMRESSQQKEDRRTGETSGTRNGDHKQSSDRGTSKSQ